MTRGNFVSMDKVKPSSWVERIWKITVIIVFIMLSMLFLPWQQTVKGEGELIAQNPSERGYMISATVDGFVNTIYVRENQYVKKGDKLFRMVDLDQNYSDRIGTMGESINNQLLYTKEEFVTLNKNRSNLIEQMQTGEELYGKRYQQAKDQLENIRLKKIALEQNLNVELFNYDRIKELHKESIESKRSLERAENSYVKAKTELEKNEVEYNVQKRQLEIIEKEKQQFLLDASNRIRTIENSMNSAQVRLNGLKREDARQVSDMARYETSDVRAQKDGYVLRVLVNDKNLYLSKGEPVLQFAPDVTKRTLVFKVSDFHMPLIKKGLNARIMFYGWPAFQISGWPTIKHGTFSGIVERVDPIAFEKGFYYAYIVEDPKDPWPSDEILRVGTRGSVWVRLSVVPIWSEIWRIMNAAPPKMVYVDPAL